MNADNRNQDASKTRRAMTARMEQTIGTANILSGYTGKLKDEQGWHYTINDKPLRLYAIHNENMAIKQAARYCREYGPITNTTGTTRLWDRDTARAKDMPELMKDQKYWIRSEVRTADNNIRQCATL